MISILKQRSLKASILLMGAVLLQTACAGSDKEQSELATEVTETEPAEAPSQEPVAEVQPAPTTETAAVTEPTQTAPQPAPTASPAPTDGRPRVVRYVSSKEAVLRAAPSDTAAKVGVLPKGERIMIVEENGWGRVADDIFVKLNALSPKAVPRKREKANWSKPAH